MGVKSQISLSEANRLFPSYRFYRLIPTSSGIIDTTYILYSQKNGYILKKYERNIADKIQNDIKLLKELKLHGLNTSVYLDNNEDWYLYTKLKGENPNIIKTHHIQALARFMTLFHKYTKEKKDITLFIKNYEIPKLLNYLKSNFYLYFKKLESLKNIEMKNDGLIHGDIFKDNTVFDGAKIGIFDFIDSGCGSFSFDVAVALLGFDVKKHKPYFLNLFLKTYNQHSLKKLTKKELLKQLEVASKFYALLRINKYKNTFKAKELLMLRLVRL